MRSNQEKFNTIFTEAIAEGRVRPYFQPIVCLSSGRIAGFECLARWLEPEYGAISPSIFVPLAERAGLLNEFLITIMHQAFAAASLWPEVLFLSLNVLPSQLLNPNLPKLISEASTYGHFDLHRLKIEITETADIKDMDGARAVIGKLIRLGCAVAMDDFGTGYSSMAWLRSLPFDTIKIDQSFVHTMLEQRESRKIVSAVVSLGHSLGLTVVAEGVETDAEMDLLRLIGCPLAQGYLFGLPMPPEMVSAALQKQQSVTASVKLEKMSMEQRAYQITALYRAPETSVCFIDHNYVLVDASETFAQRIGQPLNQILGQNVYNILPQERSRLGWLRSFRERKMPYPAFEFKRPDDHIDMVTLTCVTDEIGEVMGFFILANNISERKCLNLTEFSGASL